MNLNARETWGNQRQLRGSFGVLLWLAPILVLWPNRDPSPVSGGLALCLVSYQASAGISLDCNIQPERPGWAARLSCTGRHLPRLHLSPHSSLPCTANWNQLWEASCQSAHIAHLGAFIMLSSPLRTPSHLLLAKAVSSFKAFREGLGRPPLC